MVHQRVTANFGPVSAAQLRQEADAVFGRLSWKALAQDIRQGRQQIELPHEAGTS